MPHAQLSLLKTRRFLPLFVTQFLGAFNDNAFKNALVILITYRAAGKIGVDPRQMVTAAAGIFILPFLLFSALAGQLADKFEKSQLVRIIKGVEIVLMLTAAAGFYLENYWLLMAVLFGMGLHSTFFGPLKYSILPDHLREEELIGANALVEAATFVAILLGTILGGVLILRDASVVSCVITGLALAGWLASREIPATPVSDKALKLNFNFIAETWRMTRQTMAQRGVFLAILGASWFWLVGFTFLAQFPTYAKTVLGANQDIVTLFLTVFSIGIALGSLVCNRLLKGKVSATYVPPAALGMAAFGALLWMVSPALAPPGELRTLGAFLADPKSWLIIGSLLGLSVCGGIYIVPLYTLMQTQGEKNRRSRTIAVNNILNALFMVGGTLFTMVMLKAGVSVTGIFLIVGLANIPAAALLRRIA